MSRRRYVHRPGHPRANDMGMVDVAELGAEDSPMEEGRQPVFTDRYMEGTFVDGPQGPVDIGSRKKRRAHMETHGLADYGDFTEHWKKKQQDRDNPRLPGIERAAARAYDELSKGKG